MAMPMKFQYAKLGSAEHKWYIGELITWIKDGSMFKSFTLRTAYGPRMFKIERVAESERQYVRDCLSAAEQLANTMAKLEMQRIIKGK